MLLDLLSTSTDLSTSTYINSSEMVNVDPLVSNFQSPFFHFSNPKYKIKFYIFSFNLSVPRLDCVYCFNRCEQALTEKASPFSDHL